MILFSIGIYFLILILVSQKKSKKIPGKFINLLRSLFPSWKFYQDFENENKIFFRIQNDFWGPWIEIKYSTPPIHWNRIFFNADVNYLLAIDSLLQDLINDLDEAFLEEKISFQLVHRLVFLSIPKCTAYQFKINEDELISPEYFYADYSLDQENYVVNSSFSNSGDFTAPVLLE